VSPHIRPKRQVSGCVNGTRHDVDVNASDFHGPLPDLEVVCRIVVTWYMIPVLARRPLEPWRPSPHGHLLWPDRIQIVLIPGHSGSERNQSSRFGSYFLTQWSLPSSIDGTPVRTDRAIDYQRDTDHAHSLGDRLASNMSSSALLRTGIVPDARSRPVNGEGTYITLADGRRVIDASATPLALGHRHPRILEAVGQALRTSPTLDEGFSTSLRESTAEELLRTVFAGEDWVGGVRFALTGSEANDMALSLAQALTGRSGFVTRERAYHGMVGLARDITVQPQWHGGLSSRSGGVRPVPRSSPVRVLPFPQGRFGDGLALSRDQAEDALADGEALLADSAAVIIDYTQGGCYPAPAYQDVLARKARSTHTLWIADEVVTGFGKCGRWLNFQRGEERPDIVTLGKSMGGGVAPAAAVVLSKDMIELIGDSNWANYSSMRSSDLAAAAAREFVRVIAEEDYVRRADALHDSIEAGMRTLAATHPSVSRVDGRGLHWWIEVGDSDWRQWRGDGRDVSVATQVAAAVLDAGAMVATTGEANVVLVTLPMIIEDRELDAVLSALDHGLALADRIVPEGAPSRSRTGAVT